LRCIFDIQRKCARVLYIHYSERVISVTWVIGRAVGCLADCGGLSDGGLLSVRRYASAAKKNVFPMVDAHTMCRVKYSTFCFEFQLCALVLSLRVSVLAVRVLTQSVGMGFHFA